MAGHSDDAFFPPEAGSICNTTSAVLLLYSHRGAESSTPIIGGVLREGLHISVQLYMTTVGSWTDEVPNIVEIRFLVVVFYSAVCDTPGGIKISFCLDTGCRVRCK